MTDRSDSGARKSMRSSRPNIAALTPTPSASVATTAAVNSGRRRAAAQRVAHVLHDVFDEHGAVRVAGVVLDSIHATEGEACVARCLLASHAARATFLGFAIEVEAHLFIHLTFDAPRDGRSCAGDSASRSTTRVTIGVSLRQLMSRMSDTAVVRLCHCVGLRVELFAAGASELVVLGAAVVVRGAPLGANPSASLESVEGGVERALGNLQ